MNETPLQKLELFLRLYHPNYTIHDVELSNVKGFLKCTKPCPRNNYWCKSEEHYHTIDIYGVGYPKRDKGKFVSPYRLWNELHGYLRKEAAADEHD